MKTITRLQKQIEGFILSTLYYLCDLVSDGPPSHGWISYGHDKYSQELHGSFNYVIDNVDHKTIYFYSKESGLEHLIEAEFRGIISRRVMYRLGRKIRRLQLPDTLTDREKRDMQKQRLKNLGIILDASPYAVVFDSETGEGYRIK